jgi:hypothetical protein
MSNSPFAAFANATLRFEVASGELTTDSATGNVKPGKAIVEVSAILDQAKVPEATARPGVDSTAVYLEGFVVEVVGADNALRLPSVVTPDSPCAATWDGKGGRFFLQLKGHSPYGYEAITGDEIQGYFQVSKFAVEGEAWTPSPEPTPEPQTDYESAEVDSAVLMGQPLYLKVNGHADLAQANAIATARVCGLAVADATATTAATYSPDGVVQRSDWTPITGTASLTPGTFYFLDPDLPGKLTTIAPELSGLVVANVGIALSATKLAIEIQPIYLM